MANCNLIRFVLVDLPDLLRRSLGWKATRSDITLLEKPGGSCNLGLVKLAANEAG